MPKLLCPKSSGWVLLVWVEQKPFVRAIRFLGSQVADIECEHCGWLRCSWCFRRCCAPGFRGLILILLEQLSQAGIVSEKEMC
jgi:hypothetical protein